MSAFESQLAQVTELISLPEIYLKVSRLMDDKTSEVEDFAAVISYDPNLSATVLKVVNSAFYGFSGQIDSISRAINLMGIGQLHIIVLSVSAISAIDAVNYPDDLIPLKTFWRSSLFSGVLARQLATHKRLRKSERLFVIGLLHEIGHLVLYTKFPQKARQVIQSCADNNEKIHETEQRLLGCHYGTIGARLMQGWHLPEKFSHITAHQPTPESAQENKAEIAILHIAHAYAAQQFIQPEEPLDQLIHPNAWEIAGLNPDIIESSLDSVQAISADMECVILR